MSNRIQEEPRVEIEVISWNEIAQSFTTAGPITPQLDRLIRNFVLIRNLVLTEDGETIAEITNVHLMASHSHLRYPPGQSSASGMKPAQWTDFEYETLNPP